MSTSSGTGAWQWRLRRDSLQRQVNLSAAAAVPTEDDACSSLSSGDDEEEYVSPPLRRVSRHSRRPAAPTAVADPNLESPVSTEGGLPTASAHLSTNERFTYRVENVPKCRKPIVVQRHPLCRQAAVLGLPPQLTPRRPSPSSCGARQDTARTSSSKHGRQHDGSSYKSNGSARALNGSVVAANACVRPNNGPTELQNGNEAAQNGPGKYLSEPKRQTIEKSQRQEINSSDVPLDSNSLFRLLYGSQSDTSVSVPPPSLTTLTAGNGIVWKPPVSSWVSASPKRSPPVLKASVSHSALDGRSPVLAASLAVSQPALKCTDAGSAEEHPALECTDVRLAASQPALQSTDVTLAASHPALGDNDVSLAASQPALNFTDVSAAGWPPGAVGQASSLRVDTSPRPQPRRRLPAPPASRASRRRLLPTTPQSSVESAPAAYGRHSPTVAPPSPRLSATSTPCLSPDEAATEAAEPSPRQQYFRYSHLLIFPLQYFGSEEGGGTLLVASSREGSSARLSASPSPPTGRRHRHHSERGRTRPRRHRATAEDDLSRSLPSLLPQGLSARHPGDGGKRILVTGASLDNAALTSADPAVQRRTFGSLGGYDPYDPFRPIRHKRKTSPPPKKHKTRFRSLANMEWKILKAFEPEAFRPPLRAWRSGIDVSATHPAHLTQDLLSDPADESAAASPGGGRLQLSAVYDAPSQRLSVTLLQAEQPPRSGHAGFSYTQVRLVLLPEKKQRLRSRMHPHDVPEFNQTFFFSDIDADDLSSSGVRLRLYGCERLRRSRLLGEVILPCTGPGALRQQPRWISLQSRLTAPAPVGGADGGDSGSICRSESTSSGGSVRHGGRPELLLGLQYSAPSGRLTVNVVRGSHLRTAAGGRSPDTYVRLHLVTSAGRRLARSRTSVRRSQANPLYRETFMFQIPLFDLSDVTLIVSVYNKFNMKRRELIGWFGLGHSSSSEEERVHWADVRDARGAQICRWHLLCEK